MFVILYLLNGFQALNNADVVQIDASGRVPVLYLNAELRHSQAFQKLLEILVIIVNDAVLKRTETTK